MDGSLRCSNASSNPRPDYGDRVGRASESILRHADSRCAARDRHVASPNEATALGPTAVELYCRARCGVSGRGGCGAGWCRVLIAGLGDRRVARGPLALNALGFSHSASFLDDERRDPEVRQAWKDVLPYAWHPDRTLSVEQLLTEVGERSHSHYQQIWESCTPAEKLVLGRLPRRDWSTARRSNRTDADGAPAGAAAAELVLLNETFRQFVLSESSRAEVTVLEQETNSAWDAIRRRSWCS